MPQLKVQNQYNTTITEASGIPASGDATFTVWTPPVNTNGFIVISPDISSQREIMYYHNVIGNTIYVRGDNRILPKPHSQTEVVKMNDVAEIFNFFSDMIGQAFYVEKTGWLNVNVWGWYVYYNGLPQTVADTPLVLANNTTNYIKYAYNTNSFSVDTINTWNIKAQVVTLGWVITSIWYRTAKESYIDFTVALTWALPPQAGQAGKSLMTDGTNASWGTNNNLRTSLGASRKNIEVDASGNEVAVAVTSGTTLISTDTIRKQTVWGLYEDIPLSVVEWAVSNNGATSLAAGETLAANDFVYEEKLNTFLAAYTTTVPSVEQNIGNIAANTRVQGRLIWNGVSASSLKIQMNKAGTPVDNVTFRIETSTAWSPSGTLVNANATASIAWGTITGWSTEVTVNFAWAFTIPAWTVCHLVIARSGANDPANYYQTALYTRRVRGFTMSLFNASWGATITSTTLGIIYTGAYSSLVCKTDATYAGTSSFTGWVSSSVAVGAITTIQKSGNNKGESGLTPWAAYYISSTTPGDISTTPWTVVRFVWFAKSATEIAVLEAENNLSLTDQWTANYITVWNTTSVFKQWIATLPCTILVTANILLQNQTARTSGVAFNVVPGDIISFYGIGTQTLQILQKAPQSWFFTI